MSASEFSVIGSRYDLEGPPVRSGSRGALYKARDRVTQAFVAVRILSKENSSDVDPTARLGDRPGVARFLDSGVDPVAGSYSVTEWLDGANLSTLLDEQRRLDWQDVADLGVQVATAFAGIDGAGIRFHGDLRPENILRTRDGLKYKVTDFLAVGRFPLDSPYTAPEVALRGGDIDERIDQFSLGVVLYEALTGSLPRSGGRLSDALRLSSAEVPASLVAVIERLLEVDPEARFRRWSDVVDAFRRSTVSEATSAAAPTAVRRGWGMLLVLTTLFAATVGLFLWFGTNGPQDEIRMGAARKDAEILQASKLAVGLWGQAENFNDDDDYAARTRLYQASREAAWQARVSNVADLAQKAADFEAKEDEGFRSAAEARVQAEKDYAASRFADAVRLIGQAEEGFRTATWTKRQRWSDQIRQIVDTELAKVPATVSGHDIEQVRSERQDMESRLTGADVNPGQLRQLQVEADSLRGRITSLLTSAASSDAARKAATEAVTRAEQAQRIAQAWQAQSSFGRSTYDHGVEVLGAAKNEIAIDTKHAAALADEATKILRSVGEPVREELRAARAAAATARAAANKHDASRLAAAPYSAGEAAWIEAEQGGEEPVDFKPRRANYEKAKRSFDEAGRLASKHVEATPTRVVVEATPTRFVPTPILNPPRLAPAAPAAPAPAPAKVPASAGGADLGRMVQAWMGVRCEELNREAGRTSTKARCESLTILDRRDSEEVKVSFLLTLGHTSGAGTEWQTPEGRVNILDCAGASCRCTSGPDCR